MDLETGEALVMQDALHSCVQIHIRGTTPDEYRVIRLSRHEARRLAALILFQAERLDPARRPPVDRGFDTGTVVKSA